MEKALLQALKEGKGMYLVSGKDLLNFHNSLMDEVKREKEYLTLERMLNVDEVATLLATTPRSLRRWDEEGYLKPIKIGGVNKWRYSDVFRLMNGEETLGR